jgi:hypothetical protein
MTPDDEITIAQLRADLADIMAAVVRLAVKSDLDPEDEDVPLDVWESYRGAKIANDLMMQIEGNKLDADFATEFTVKLTGPEMENDPSAWRIAVAHYRAGRWRR